MELTNKKKVVILVVYTAIAVSFGRYLVPQKIKIEKETVKAETNVEHKNDKEKTDTNRDKHIETVITEKTLPDGTKEKTTKVVEDTKAKTVKVSDENTTDTSNKTETDKETKTVERGSSKTNIYALAAINVQTPSNGLIYGLHVSREIFGPISIGVFGMTDKTLGLSVGLSF